MESPIWTTDRHEVASLPVPATLAGDGGAEPGVAEGAALEDGCAALEAGGGAWAAPLAWHPASATVAAATAAAARQR